MRQVALSFLAHPDDAEILCAGTLVRLKEAGWRTGSVAEFLELTPEDSALIEIKLRLTELAKKARARRHLSQVALAERIGSSQSRVAKLEAGDPSVSLELLGNPSLHARHGLGFIDGQ